ncbi:hypothetical protein PENTCL1PPCAC_28892, partial [Pristionchus entomophagus]
SEVFLQVYKMFLGSHQLGLRAPWLLGEMARLVCRPFNHEICRDVVHLALGPPSKTSNWTRMPVYLSNFLASTSTWTLMQWGQVKEFLL